LDKSVHLKKMEWPAHIIEIGTMINAQKRTTEVGDLYIR